MDALDFPQPDEGQAAWLERSFDEVEVRKADKAPRPDGFSLAFYKACWEVIRGDLILVVNDFFERSFLDKGVMPHILP